MKNSRAGTHACDYSKIMYILSKLSFLNALQLSGTYHGKVSFFN